MDTEAGAIPAIPTDMETFYERRVLIYWHDAGLTKKDAVDLSVELRGKGFQVDIEQHRDPRAPDSIFIGALVTARDAQAVLSSLPYKPEYIFRHDYPEIVGGDPEGKLIGVGYRSTHMSWATDKRLKPVHISPDQFSSLLERGLSSADFQIRLREIINQQSDPETHNYNGVDFGSYQALLIGNNEYKHLTDLRNPHRDVEKLSKVLTDEYGFNAITIIKDATRSEIITALDKLRNSLGKRDNLLIYYAGHGWLDEEADRGYWLPVDADKNSRVNWVSNATITDSLKVLLAKHVMVVADSCYSGKLTRLALPIILESNNIYFNRLVNKRARTVMTSGGLEPVDDGKGDLSPFAAAFIDVIKMQSEKVVDTATLFPKIRRKVMLETDQTPEYTDIRKVGHDGGDFLFVRQSFRASQNRGDSHPEHVDR
jgi:hypothetical protein